MKRNRRKIISIICIIIFTATAVYTGFQAYTIYAEKKAGENSYADLEQYISMSQKTSDVPMTQEESGISDTYETSPEDQTIIFPEIDFESLREINSQVVGWICCEDTVINYPIVQAEDNDYYVHHLFDGQYNSSGCIFLDYRNSSDFSDRHSIIYGHHMRNGNMFAGLTKYKDQEYYEDHPLFLMMTPQQNYVVEIFAGYVASVEDEAWDVDFDSEKAYLDWLDKSVDKSAIRTGIIPAADDKILTLSTCSYEFENARFVLLGILREAF